MIDMGRTNLVFLLSLLACLSISFGWVSAATDINIWNSTCISNTEYDLLCSGQPCTGSNVMLNLSHVCSTQCNSETNTCDAPQSIPTDFFSLMVISLLAIAGLFIVIGIKFKDDWGIMPILFFISAMIIIVAAIGIIGSYFVAGQNSISDVLGMVYLACGFILVIFVAYIIMRWIIAFAIKFLKDIEAKKRRI